MFGANPELNALRTARMAAAIVEGAELVAADIGAAPHDPGPRIVAVAATVPRTAAKDTDRQGYAR